MNVSELKDNQYYKIGQVIAKYDGISTAKAEGMVLGAQLAIMVSEGVWSPLELSKEGYINYDAVKLGYEDGTIDFQIDR